MADAVDALIKDLERYAAQQRTAAEESEATARTARSELARVEEALAALGAVGEAAPRAATRRRPASDGPAAPRARRGENQEKVLALVGDRPGVTPGEVAQVTGIKQAIVYNVLRTLDGRGRIERTDLGGGRTGYRLAAEDSPDGPEPAAEAERPATAEPVPAAPSAEI